MWRVTRGDLLLAGFDMRLIDAAGEDLRRFAQGFPDDERGLHINVLELLAIVINTWLVLRHVRGESPLPGGWIVQVLADNTSALSWFHRAARVHRTPAVANLTFFCQALIAFSHTDHLVCFQGRHLSGRDNVTADALSRPSQFPSINFDIAPCSPLRICRFFQLPFALLSSLARIVSSPLTAAAFEHETITLLTLVPHSLSPGSEITPSTPRYWRRSARRSSRS
jgi:hypothetical protein